MKRSSSFLRVPITALVVALAACAATAPAATLTWDADGTTTGTAADGAGAWLGANQWWDGSSNLTWTSGDDAVFGVGGTGGAVTLSAPTTAGSLTFNGFTGTYTLGTSGQTLTLGGGGIAMNAGAGAVTLSSPVTLGTAQSWTNNSSSLLTASAAITNGGFGLTVAGSGNTTLSGIVSGTGSLTKTGAGTLTLGNVQNTFTGGTIVNGGTLTLGTGLQNGNIRGSLTINAGATVNANAGNWSLGYGGTRSGATYGGISVTDIAINGGLLNFTNGLSGAGLAANSIVLTGGTIGGTSFGWINSNTLTPTLQTLASSTRSTLSGGISLRLSGSGALTFDVASGSTSDGTDLAVGPITDATAVSDNAGGRVIKTGAGRMVFTGSNTFSGGLTLSAGQLDLNHASALGTGTFTITGGTIGNSSGSQIILSTNNAQLWNSDITFVGPSILQLGTGTATLNASRTVTVSTAELVVGSVSGSGFGLTKAGAGKLSLSGSSGYTGPTDVTSGILQFGIGGTAGALSPASTITGSAGATLAFARSNTITQGVDFASTIGGALNVSQITAGTLVLNGANTFTGTTRIVAGTLSLGNTLAIQNSTLDLNSADSGGLAFGVSGTNTYVVGGLIGSRSLTLSNTVVLSVGGNGSSGTYSGVISGSGGLVKTGTGTLTLGNVTNSFTGGTVVSGGTLTLGNGGADGNLRGSLTINQGATVNADATGWSLGYGGTRSGAEYSGNSVTSIAINGGLLNITNPQAGAGLSANSIVLTGGTIGGGSFGWYNTNTLTPVLQTLASSTRSTLSGGISLRLSGSGTLTFDVASGSTADGLDLVVSGPIANAGTAQNNGGNLTKTGAGTLLLSGSNTFTGGVTVTGGTLAVQGWNGSAGALPANTNLAITNATVTTTGTFANALSGGQTSGVITINAGGLLYAGNSTNNAHNVFNVVLAGGTMASGTGSPGAALANWYVNGGITATGSTTSVISASLGKTNSALAITVDPGSTLTVSGPIVNLNGANGLTKSGSGLLSLSATNTFTGGLTVSAGTLQLTGAGVLGSGSYAGAVSIASGATFALAGSASQTLSGAISGSGGLVKTGAGTLTLGNVTNTYSGGTIVNGGVLTLGSGGANGNIRGSLTINQGATVNASASNWSLGYGGTRSGATYSGTSVTSISINGGLLNFTNGYSGAGVAANSIILNGGTIGGSFGWINTNTLTPTLQTLASSARSTLSGGISLRLSTSGTLTFDVASGSTPDGIDLFVGPITSSTISPDNNGGSLIKTGAGTMVLSGLNTYTGATSITGGRLRVDSTGSINSTSGITINGGDLRYNAATALTRPITFTAGTISGTGSIGTAVTAAAGDILSPGNSPGAQAYTAGLTWSGSGSYLWELNALSGTSGVNWDVINVSGGTFNLSGLSAGSRFILDLTTLTGSNTAGGLDLPYDGGSYAFLIASYTSLSTPLGTAAGTDLTSLFDLRLTNWATPKPLPENLSVRINGTANGIELIVVPEPAALALGGLGAATAGWVIWRRRRRGRNIAGRPTAD